MKKFLLLSAASLALAGSAVWARSDEQGEAHERKLFRTLADEVDIMLARLGAVEPDEVHVRAELRQEAKCLERDGLQQHAALLGDGMQRGYVDPCCVREIGERVQQFMPFGRDQNAADHLFRHAVALDQQRHIFAEFVKRRAGAIVAALDLDADNMSKDVARQDVDPAAGPVRVVEGVFDFEKGQVRLYEIEMCGEKVPEFVFIGKEAQNGRRDYFLTGNAHNSVLRLNWTIEGG